MRLGRRGAVLRYGWGSGSRIQMEAPQHQAGGKRWRDGRARLAQSWRQTRRRI
ncbi:hypothetical protein CGRA01v4_01695 [Colletotrichum graminicola]|nr:hypothetical protein CGRA01v4_01695 [Colletotrichum graminicola]